MEEAGDEGDNERDNSDASMNIALSSTNKRFTRFELNDLGKIELKLADLLGDLHSLAIDPFLGRERNSRPTFTCQAFLTFCSLVFQKSLGLSTPSEVEPNENHDLKPGKSCDIIPSAIKDQPSSKNPKSLFQKVKTAVRICIEAGKMQGLVWTVAC